MLATLTPCVSLGGKISGDPFNSTVTSNGDLKRNATAALRIHDTLEPDSNLDKESLQYDDNLSTSTIAESPEMPGLPFPLIQRAVLTPEMGENLNLVLRKIAVREPDNGEAVIQILYSGICRSDASFSIGPGAGYPKQNHIAGHEGIGRVIKSHDPFIIGRTFGIRYLGKSCGSCTYCLRGLFTSCPSQLNVPKHITGTFQEYATVPTSCLVPLPDAFLRGDVDLALYTAALCSGSTALVSVRAAKPSLGDVVIVVGVAGAIGHLTGAIAKQIFGARVIGIDLKSKIDVIQSQDYGDYSDILLSAPETNAGDAWSDFHSMLMQSCEKLRRNYGLRRAAEAVIVASSSFSAFQRLDEYVYDGGRIVCVG
ncbi:Alcohol dehydrogenase superfamily, zinc-type [Penicillium expansum]|uniref:Alcohol dehydrogenase superfamily, zinc-type n=1 Tax=Penicillium expansum TaxID=27334 RepID=A0A0A2J5J1_PENEN|nr:Alcohol dehydrogenase superfamily, zinc-type [Penicillium expansum]KGO47640.1 Alcohol dehydrogenase superfamily, zinc-type [Penicillium expansum]KGO50192.1 Alcohol dehydrogenase superfamily, zinc-type [Penicillium expansum]KGO61093.1 Alcohol dehydrogenase superfamily, zinc-type [Penicillium expansum]